MPMTLPQIIARSVETGIYRAIQRAADRYVPPQLPEKVGLTVGALILTIGWSAERRRRRLQRIEQKLDLLVEHE